MAENGQDPDLSGIIPLGTEYATDAVASKKDLRDGLQTGASPEINVEEELIKQQEAIKYLVFSGGGAKGAVNTGAVQALHDAGVIEGLDAVAGSSAGALTATLVAIGLSPEAFREICADMDFKNLPGQGPRVVGDSTVKALADVEARHAEAQEQAARSSYLLSSLVSAAYGAVSTVSGVAADVASDARLPIQRDGVPLYEKTQEIIQSTIQSYVASHRLRYRDFSARLQQHLANLDPVGDAAEIRALREISTPGRFGGFLNQLKSEQHKITFADLACLRFIDPTRFKELNITATTLDGQLQIFNAHNTPDVEIATASRASAALPVVFDNVEIEINGVRKKYIDGGVGNNIPMNQFLHRPGRTLALAFAKDGLAQRAIHGSPTQTIVEMTAFNVLQDKIVAHALSESKGFSFNQRENEVYNVLRQQALNVMQLHTASVDTTDFDGATKHADLLHIMGQCQGTRYLINQGLQEPLALFAVQEFFMEMCAKYVVDSASSYNPFVFLQKGKWLDDIQPIQDALGQSLSEKSEADTANQPGKLILQMWALQNDRVKHAFLNGLNSRTCPLAVKDEVLKLLLRADGGESGALPSFTGDTADRQAVARFQFTVEQLNTLNTLTPTNSARNRPGR